MPAVSFVVVNDPSDAPLSKGCELNLREVIYGLQLETFTPGTILLDMRHKTVHKIVLWKEHLQITPSLRPATKGQEQSIMSKLKSIITEMYDYVETHPNEPIKRRLSKGLRIDLMNSCGDILLQISRTDEVYPSEDEWTTVCNSFPLPVFVTPKQTKHAGRNYLKARFPIQPKLFTDPTLQPART